MEAYKFRVAAQLVAILEIIWTCFGLLGCLFEGLLIYLWARKHSQAGVVSVSFGVSAIVVLYLLAALLLSIALLLATKADENPARASKWVVAWLLFQWISLCITLMIGTVGTVVVLVSPLIAFLLMGLVVLFRTPGLYLVHKYRSELGGMQQLTRQV